MKVYKLEPLGDLQQVDIPNELAPLQEAVGGWIEVVSLSGVNGNTVIICDEEGKLKGKEPCAFIRGEVFVGTILFAGVDRRGEFCDCPMTEDEIRTRIGRRIA